jgi:hypothetical protein
VLTFVRLFEEAEKDKNFISYTDKIKLCKDFNEIRKRRDALFLSFFHFSIDDEKDGHTSTSICYPGDLRCSLRKWIAFEYSNKGPLLLSKGSMSITKIIWH